MRPDSDDVEPPATPITTGVYGIGQRARLMAAEGVPAFAIAARLRISVAEAQEICRLHSPAARTLAKIVLRSFT